MITEVYKGDSVCCVSVLTGIRTYMYAIRHHSVNSFRYFQYYPSKILLTEKRYINKDHLLFAVKNINNK